MRLDTHAIVVALRPHGEHGAVVRLITAEHGLLAVYVRGARGRRLRPILLPGNQVEASLSARTDTQLAQATVELVHSRGPLLQEPLPAAAIDWICALTATALPEGQSYPRLYQVFDGLLAAIEAAPSASGWGAALVRYELLVLAELGFGLDLNRCAVSGGNDDLTEVMTVEERMRNMLSRHGAHSPNARAHVQRQPYLRAAIRRVAERWSRLRIDPAEHQIG